MRRAGRRSGRAAIRRPTGMTSVSTSPARCRSSLTESCIRSAPRRAARHRGRRRRPAVVAQDGERVQRAERLLRRGGFAARRGRQGNREHRRRQGRHHRLRRAEGQRGLDGHGRCGKLFVTRRQRSRASGTRCSSHAADSSGWILRAALSGFSARGVRGRTPRSTPHTARCRQHDLHFRRRTRRGGSAARWIDCNPAVVVGRRVVEPLRHQRVFGGSALRLSRPPEYGPSLRAVDFKSGQVKWSQDKFGAGTVTLAGDQLVVMREDELLLAPATPSGSQADGAGSRPAGNRRAYRRSTVVGSRSE